RSMQAWLRLTAAVAAALAVAHPGGQPAAAHAQSATSAVFDAQSARTLIDRYCVTCHNARMKTGGLDLASVDAAAPAQHANVFEMVITKLRAGVMPPAGQRRPDSTDRLRLVRYLEANLDRTAEIQPNPGRTEAFHRLNRREYLNAVRDLLGVDLDVA